jgi:hypothetical protein
LLDGFKIDFTALLVRHVKVKHVSFFTSFTVYLFTVILLLLLFIVALGLHEERGVVNSNGGRGKDSLLRYFK